MHRGLNFTPRTHARARGVRTLLSHLAFGILSVFLIWRQYYSYTACHVDAWDRSPPSRYLTFRKYFSILFEIQHCGELS